MSPTRFPNYILVLTKGIQIDSPTFHLFHNDATNLENYHITIRGGNKGGLDGIDITCLSNCYIHHIEVTNRDECISVKTPSKNVLIEEIYCNQSGGMSIGSLDAASMSPPFHLTPKHSTNEGNK